MGERDNLIQRLSDVLPFLHIKEYVLLALARLLRVTRETEREIYIYLGRVVPTLVVHTPR